MSRKRAYVAYISLSALNHFNQSISGLLAQKAGVSFVELNPYYQWEYVTPKELVEKKFFLAHRPGKLGLSERKDIWNLLLKIKKQ